MIEDMQQAKVTAEVMPKDIVKAVSSCGLSQQESQGLMTFMKGYLHTLKLKQDQAVKVAGVTDS